MRNMLQFKTPSLDSHSTRNQCKLIWDSAKVTNKKGQGAQKLKSASLKYKGSGPGGNLNSQATRSRSLVAARISFFEEPSVVKVPLQTVRRNSSQKEKSMIQVKISFDDHATTTFEYEGEESALENYLQEHPEEREEVQKQEEDVATHSTEELLHDSPRAPDPDVSAMKSNTVIGSSGALTSYKSKMQTQEFQFGMNLEPEEPQYNYREPDEEVDENSMQLLPADENELDTFSAEVGKADMLF